MLKIKEINNLTIEFAPFRILETDKLVQSIYQAQFNQTELLCLLQENLDYPINYPILLTLYQDIKEYYPLMLNKLLDFYKKEIDNMTDYSLEYSPFLYCSLTSILDNNYVDDQFKKSIIKKLFNYLLTTDRGIFFWNEILYYLYSNRKNSLPIYLINIMFDKIVFNIKDKFAINNVFLNEWIIKYLTQEEIKQCIPRLMKKEGFKTWLFIYKTYDAYIWLISRIAMFLPYQFTKENLLPLITNPYNSDIEKALLSMFHLKKDDKEWLQSIICLKHLEKS